MILEGINWLICDIERQPLYWAAMVLAIAGAWLSSGASPKMRGLGFFVWIFSNGYLLYQFYLGQNLPMILTFLFYELCNIRGVINNWFKKEC